MDEITVKNPIIILFSLECSLALGYAYPAYACYKMLDLRPPQIEQLLFWCQYWYIYNHIGSSGVILQKNMILNLCW